MWGRECVQAVYVSDGGRTLHPRCSPKEVDRALKNARHLQLSIYPTTNVEANAFHISEIHQVTPKSRIFP